MGFALKARRAGDSSHRPANAQLTAQEQRLANLMQRAADLLAQGANSPELRQAIRDANLAQTLDSLPWQEYNAALNGASDILANEINTAGGLLNGMPSMAPLPTGMQASFTFNSVDPRALAWAQSQAAALVTEVSANTRLAIQQVIVDGFRNNLSVDQIARELRSATGLTAKQAKAVSRAYDMALEGNLANGMPLGEAQTAAATQSAAVQRRLLKARATTIARTEILRAQNNGRYLGWTQAVESGFVENDAMKKWDATVASLSGVVCDRCRPMNGEIVRWDESFSNGVNMPPAHPNCRCTALLLPPQPASRNEGVEQVTDFSTPAPAPVGIPRRR